MVLYFDTYQIRETVVLGHSISIFPASTFFSFAITKSLIPRHFFMREGNIQCCLPTPLKCLILCCIMINNTILFEVLSCINISFYQPDIKFNNVDTAKDFSMAHLAPPQNGMHPINEYYYLMLLLGCIPFQGVVKPEEDTT